MKAVIAKQLLFPALLPYKLNICKKYCEFATNRVSTFCGNKLISFKKIYAKNHQEEDNNKFKGAE